MNKMIFPLGFALGLCSVTWIGIGFVDSGAIALLMTAVIAGVYLLGGAELRQFRAATAALAQALAEIPESMQDLGDWLARVPPTLRNTVRLRLEGERAAMPGPALTPYLVGLLVMLGMLGTFVGMVMTFKGAVFALEGSTDLQAMRSALAAPIKGLGLSFGTSVAGVAASAMLGLLSALSRRERRDVSRQLDSRIATVLRPFSLTHQRQQTYQAVQAQAQALPAVVDQLQSLIQGIEQRNQQLNDQLLGQQTKFHQEVSVAYTDLAGAVRQTLVDSLRASATAATESLQPMIGQAIAGMAESSQRMHQQVFDATQAQVGNLVAGFDQRTHALLDTVQAHWSTAQAQQAAAEQQQREAWQHALVSQADTLHANWQRSTAQTLAQQQTICQTLETTAGNITAHAHQQAEHMDQWAGLWRGELSALRDEEAARGAAALERLGLLQSALAEHLATLGAALEAPMHRLMQTAAEVPQAAAGVIQQLQQEMVRITERDHLALEERATLMRRIDALLHTLTEGSTAQRDAVLSLVNAATASLDQAAARVAGTLESQASHASDAAAQVSASAIELASLGTSFQHGVAEFSASNDKLVEGLQRIESTIQQSMARSDEQLAYYVAQAREVIDLSITSQQGILEDLRSLPQRLAQLEGSAG